jgi:hypothetical protein
MTQPNLLTEIIGGVHDRSEQPTIACHTQDSHDILPTPADPAGLSLAEPVLEMPANAGRLRRMPGEPILPGVVA